MSGAAALALAELYARHLDDALEFPSDGRRFSTRAGTHGTNRFGLHERDLPDTPPPGVRRIVVLGDSMTWGTASPAEAWPRAVETQLGAPWQTVNLSHYGYDAEQALATLQSFGWRNQPAAVVFGTYANDLVPTELITVGSPAMPAWVGASFLFPGAGRSSLGRRLEGAVRTRYYVEAEDPARFAAAVMAMRDAADAAGVPFFVVLLAPHVLAEPDPERCDAFAGSVGRCAAALELAARQLQMVTQLGVPAFSVVPALQAGPERVWFPADSDDWEHPSPAGHTLIGAAVADWLAALLPVAASR